MSGRKINISKCEGNTHWSVHVYDSYGQEHHIGYYQRLKGVANLKNIELMAEEIWKNEVEPKESLLSNAIGRCIEIDKERGVEPKLD